jgi:hypothetical protein
MDNEKRKDYRNFLTLEKGKNCADKKLYNTVIPYRSVAGVAEWLRRRAADPLYVGSIPTPGSNMLKRSKLSC